MNRRDFFKDVGGSRHFGGHRRRRGESADCAGKGKIRPRAKRFFGAAQTVSG